MTVLTPISYETWMLQAACRDHDPDLWYPAEGDEDARKQALRICAGCPVRPQCLIWAFVTDDRYGILGGRTKVQRSVIRNRMKRMGRWTQFITRSMNGSARSAGS